MKNLWELKREFLEHCEIEKGQAVLTIDNYGRYLDRFLTWLEKESGKEKRENSMLTEDNIVPFVKRAAANHENSTFAHDRSSKKDLGGSADSQQLTIDDITEDRIRQYRLYINRLSSPDGKELKTTTQNHHILALRAFLRFLLSRGIQVVPPEKLSLAKTGEREISFMNQDEYQRLLQAPNILDIEGLRDRAILEILFSTGMRVSELASCNIGQINFDQGEIAILGKGKKLRVVFLSDTALDYLIKYLRARGAIKINPKPETRNPKQIQNYNNKDECHSKFLPADRQERSDNEVEGSQHRDNDENNDRASDPESYILSNKDFSIVEQFKNHPLFLSSRGNRMNVRGIERLVKKYSRIAGISKSISPHSLRHTFATDLLSAGADIRSVQSMLGHSNLSTTQIYTHVTDQHLREVHKKFHGRSSNNTDSNVA